MEVSQLILITVASVLFLAEFTSSELSPECRALERNCENSYLVSLDEGDGSDSILCNTVREYADCIHGLECEITRDEQKLLIDNAMNDLQGLVCDFNSATRPCSISSVMTVLLIAVFMFFKM